MNNQADTGNGMDVVIEVEDLHKQYPGIRALDGISFTVQRGEIFGMVGPNGAGKSTTIECIEGLRSPDSGRIRVLGLNPCRDNYALHEQIGIQFQTAALPTRIQSAGGTRPVRRLLSPIHRYPQPAGPDGAGR